DPVCGMWVEPENARGSAVYKDRTYYFCSPPCEEKFTAEPERYLDAKPSSGLVQLGAIAPAKAHASAKPLDSAKQKAASSQAPQSGKTGVTYVCPMDPEVRESKPGPCPICGMALEPRVAVGVHEEDDPELRSMTRRFWTGVALSIPLLVLSMGAMTKSAPLHSLSGAWNQWLQLALATPVVLWGGWPFFQRGWASVINRHLNMFTLIAIGTGTAYLYRLVATIAPGFFPATFRGHNGAVEVYFETSAIIVTLVLLGQVLELRARRHT